MMKERIEELSLSFTEALGKATGEEEPLKGFKIVVGDGGASGE